MIRALMACVSKTFVLRHVEQVLAPFSVFDFVRVRGEKQVSAFIALQRVFIAVVRQR